MELRSDKDKQGRRCANENSGQRAISSPQEIEDGVKSTQTVTSNPFSILPREIYLKIFGELGSCIDKQNFMNAHIKFYDLFKSQRVLFLFEEVRNACDLPKNDQDIVEEKKLLGELNDLRCRLVCRDWDRAIRKYFQLHNSFFVFTKKEEGPPKEPIKYFPAFPCKLIKQLKSYEGYPPSWNPINLTRSVHLYLTPNERETADLLEIQNLFRNAIGTVLERHGKHIWHFYSTIDSRHDSDEWDLVAEWFRLMLELRTFDLNSEITLRRRDQKDIENMQVVEPKLNNLLVLKSSGIPALAFNKLFKNLPKLRKMQIRIANGHELFLKDFVFE